MDDMAVGSGASWKPKLLSALSYFGVLCFIPLMANKDDEVVAFHAKQGLILWVWTMAAFFILYLPGAGRILFQISTFAIPAYSVVGLVAVILQKEWKLPGVYELSLKL